MRRIPTITITLAALGLAAITAISIYKLPSHHAAPATSSATAAATTRAPAPPNAYADNAITRLDIPYASHDPALNTLDLYAPKDAKNAPTLLFVHGGEWSRGDKQPVSYKPKFFNDHGIIFISTNYRLSPKAPHPAQVDDVAEAVAWAHSHIAQYGGDPHKIVLLGHSAGCHIVSYIALNPEPLAKAGLKPSDLAAIVAWSGGMYDLVDRFKAGGMYKPYIEATFGPDDASQRAGSPLTYVGNAASAPHFLVASCDDDHSASSRQASQNLIDAINAHGGNAQPLILKDRAHRAAIEQLGAPSDQTGQDLLKFIHSATTTK